MVKKYSEIDIFDVEDSQAILIDFLSYMEDIKDKVIPPLRNTPLNYMVGNYNLLLNLIINAKNFHESKILDKEFFIDCVSSICTTTMFISLVNAGFVENKVDGVNPFEDEIVTEIINDFSCLLDLLVDEEENSVTELILTDILDNLSPKDYNDYYGNGKFDTTKIIEFCEKVGIEDQKCTHECEDCFFENNCFESMDETNDDNCEQPIDQKLFS